MEFLWHLKFTFYCECGITSGIEKKIVCFIIVLTKALHCEVDYCVFLPPPRRLCFCFGFAVCLFVFSRITQKVIDRFTWNFLRGWLRDWKQLTGFWEQSGSGSESRIFSQAWWRLHAQSATLVCQWNPKEMYGVCSWPYFLEFSAQSLSHHSNLETTYRLCAL